MISIADFSDQSVGDSAMSKAPVVLPTVCDGLALHFGAIAFLTLIFPDGDDEGSIKALQ
jgi:hypothetical protein